MNVVERVISAFAIVLFTFLTLLVVGTVLSRHLLGFVPAWSGELQRYLAIWMTLLVAGALLNNDNHLGVGLLFNRLPSRLARYVRFLQYAIVAIIGVILINWGTEYVLDSGTASTSPSMGIPMAWVYLILPITGWLFILFTTSRIFQASVDPDTEIEERRDLDHQIELEGS